MKLKIAICDDDEMVRGDLEKTLTQISKFVDCEFDISVFSSGERLYNCYVETDCDFDAVFLDIELSEKKTGYISGTR